MSHDSTAKICLLEWLCYDAVCDEHEGLHSPKAIAFIQSNCSRDNNPLRSKTYSALRVTLKKVTKILKTTTSTENMLNVRLTKDLGDLKWTK